MLIFAFGSNLSREQMSKRCPGCKLVGPAMLDNHRLAFGSHSNGWGGGVATVVRAKGHRVRGVLYHMNEDDVLRLDAFEGTPFQYRRTSGRVRWNRKRVTAFWYVLNDKPFAPPSARYLATIASGYRQQRFSKKALRDALIYTRDRMLEQRKRKSKAKGKGNGKGKARRLTSKQISMWEQRHGRGEWWRAN